MAKKLKIKQVRSAIRGFLEKTGLYSFSTQMGAGVVDGRNERFLMPYLDALTTGIGIGSASLILAAVIRDVVALTLGRLGRDVLEVERRFRWLEIIERLVCLLPFLRGRND